MHRPFLTLVAVLAGGALTPVLAQDEPRPAAPQGQDEANEPGDAPAKPETPSLLDPQECLARMTFLYPKAASRPAASAPAGTVEERAARAKADSEWKKAVRDFAKAGDDYVRAVGEGQADATGLFYRGVGKSISTDVIPAAEVPAACDAAIDALTRYLSAAEPGAANRAEAERHLGACLLRVNRLDEAVPHLRAAVLAFARDGRKDEAGDAAWRAMSALQTAGRSDDLAAFAAAIDAAKGDFGGSTTSIRLLLAASRLSVGKPLPELPAATDADGKAVSWKPGKPLLVHFFLTGFPDGRAVPYREVETEIRPLAEQWREKGLVVVGVSMDKAMSPERVEKVKKDWDEWGVKGEVRDGSLASVRDWARKQGIDWQFTWDGQWMMNPISRALGGVGVSEPYAVLADADGIIRWHGKAPFTGLAEAVAALF